jgi:hypothetical protein
VFFVLFPQFQFSGFSGHGLDTMSVHRFLLPGIGLGKGFDQANSPVNTLNWPSGGSQPHFLRLIQILSIS